MLSPTINTNVASFLELFETRIVVLMDCARNSEKLTATAKLRQASSELRRGLFKGLPQ